MRASEGMIEAGATGHLDPERSIRPAISAAMQAVRGLLKNKAAAQLALILDCDEKTARRYFTGERIPEGERSFEMICNARLGPEMLLAATWNLPKREFDEFWDAMDDAARRARLRHRQNALEHR